MIFQRQIILFPNCLWNIFGFFNSNQFNLQLEICGPDPLIVLEIKNVTNCQSLYKVRLKVYNIFNAKKSDTQFDVKLCTKMEENEDFFGHPPFFWKFGIF